MSRRSAPADERSTLQLMQESLRQQMQMSQMQSDGYQSQIDSLRKEQERRERHIDDLRERVDTARRQRNKCEREKLQLEEAEGGFATTRADIPEMGRAGHVIRSGDKKRYERPSPKFEDTTPQPTVPGFRRGKSKSVQNRQKLRGRAESGIASEGGTNNL